MTFLSMIQIASATSETQRNPYIQILTKLQLAHYCFTNLVFPEDTKFQFSQLSKINAVNIHTLLT